MGSKVTYDEWGYVFQALNGKRLDRNELARLGTQLLNLKYAT